MENRIDGGFCRKKYKMFNGNVEINLTLMLFRSFKMAWKNGHFGCRTNYLKDIVISFSELKKIVSFKKTPKWQEIVNNK